jgi:integrase
MTIVLGPDTLPGVPRVQPPIHPYAQIAAHYRRQISAGKLKPGDDFPAISAIGEKWGVSRATAQRAVAELRDEGLLVAQRGRGTVVASP